MRVYVTASIVGSLLFAATFLFCSTPINPYAQPENIAVTFKPTGNNTDTTSWQVNQPISLDLSIFNMNLVDSIEVHYGDGTIDTVVMTPALVSAGAIVISHTYRTAGTETIAVYTYSGASARPFVKDVTIRCSAPAFAHLLTATGTRTAGARYSLCATATGSDTLHYQWYKNGTALAGSVESSLVFVALSGQDSGQYFCVVTNPCGTAVSDTDAIIFTASADSTANDRTPPAITFLSPSADTTVAVSAVQLRVNVTDGSGVAKVSINGSVAAGTGATYSKQLSLQRGVNQITVVAQDSSINQNKDTSLLKITFDPSYGDTTKPTIRFVSPKIGDTLSSSTALITVKVYDPFNVSLVKIQGTAATPGADSSYSATISIASPGAHWIEVEAWDSATARNLCVDSIMIVYDPSAPDKTPPRIQSPSPKNDSVLTDSNVTFKVTVVDDGSGVGKVTIQGVTVTSTDSVYAKNLVVKHDTTIVVYAEDASTRKNGVADTVHLFYDVTANDFTGPILTHVNPAAWTATTNKAPMTISVSATDANGIDSVTIGGMKATAAGSNYSATITLADGSNTIPVVAEDASRNHNRTTQNFTITYDVPPAAVVLQAPTAGQCTFGTVQLNWSASTESDFAKYQVRFSTTSTVDTNSPASPDQISAKAVTADSLTWLQPNTNYWARVFVYDNYPTQVGSNTVTFKTSVRVLPTLTMVYPPSNIVITSQPRISGTYAVTYPASYKSKTVTLDGAAIADTGAAGTWGVNWGTTSLAPRVWDTLVASVRDSFSDGVKTKDSTFALFYKPALSAPLAPVLTPAWTKVSISWTMVPYAQYCNVYRSTDGTSFAFLKTVATATSCVDTPVAGGTQFWYKIRQGYDTLGVKDSTGLSSAATATTQVIVAPTITSQPVSVTVASGQNAAFTIAASGSQLSYQWYLNGAAVSGATSTTYTTPATTAAYNNDSVYCIVTGLVQSVKSKVDTLKIQGVYFYDADNHVIQSVVIGKQEWMASNLMTTKFNDGTPIRNATDWMSWLVEDSAYCWAFNDTVTNKYTYGALYNGYAVMSGKLAPIGWHVPTDSEWNVLIDFAGGPSAAGAKLKEAGNMHWCNNAGSTNDYSFAALPGGIVNAGGMPGSLGGMGVWWSATRYNMESGCVSMDCTNPLTATLGTFSNVMGASVRCIKN